MRNRRAIHGTGGAVLLIGALVTGCASTNVDRAKDLSAAGVRYAQTTSAVVDVAINAIVDAESEALVRSQPRVPASASPEERQQRLAKLGTPEERQAVLDDLDAGLITSVAYYTKLRGSINSVEAYFQALQALANGTRADGTHFADATQSAVSTLADRINSLNGALEAGGGKTKPLLSDAQKTGVANLSKLVAREIHGHVVARALVRDAPVIGTALLLQQQVLEEAEGEIAAKIAEANNRFYIDKVRAPYLNATLNAAWVEDRRNYIKLKALGQSLDAVRSANAASVQMQIVWNRILSGDFNVAEIGTILKQTDELLAAVVALKAAEKPKASS